jgi:hypothetical protein
MAKRNNQDSGLPGPDDPGQNPDQVNPAPDPNGSGDNGAGVDNPPLDSEAKPEGEKGNVVDKEPEFLIGAIRFLEGKEYVKVGPNDWRPTIRPDSEISPPPADDGELVKIRNPEMKGQKMLLGNGSLVQFDNDGVIEVSGREAARLIKTKEYERV